MASIPGGPNQTRGPDKGSSDCTDGIKEPMLQIFENEELSRRVSAMEQRVSAMEHRMKEYEKFLLVVLPKSLAQRFRRMKG